MIIGKKSHIKGFLMRYHLSNLQFIPQKKL